MVSDFRREYGMAVAELVAVSFQEFMWLLQGLSKHSRFRMALDAQPKTLHNPADRAAVIAAARR